MYFAFLFASFLSSIDHKKSRYLIVYEPAMADPLSVAAGLAGVATAAISTCKVLVRVADNFIEARKRISDLTRTLAQFSSILKRLARVIEDAPDVVGEDGVRDIDSLREDCYAIVLEIKRVFKKLDTKSPSVLDRAKWLFKKSSLRYPLQRLEVAKIDLLLSIDILNVSINLQ